MREAVGFAAFVVTGGFAAAVNIATRWCFTFITSYEIAVTLAYLCGMVTAFLLMRLFVFQSNTGSARGQFVRFAMVNGVAFAQVLVVSVVLARLLFPAIGFTYQAETVAHVIGVISPIATSYVMHKRFSFRAVTT